MSPNNYDLIFDVSKIPSNIQTESGGNLEKHLQKLMPLGEIIHVNMESVSNPQNNMISLFSMVTLKKEDGPIIKEVELQ